MSVCITCHTTTSKNNSAISILQPCAFDLGHNSHVPGWPDRKRLGRLGQLHSISFARIREWTRRAGACGFLGPRRIYRRRKRGELQATSCYRDQARSHFDVGHHGIHHPSDLTCWSCVWECSVKYVVLKLPCLQLLYTVAKSIGKLFWTAPWWNNSQGDHWQIPWLLISISRFEVRRRA